MVGHGGIAAADGGQANLNQRQADNHHHHTGDQRGNNAAGEMQNAGENHLCAAGQHQGAEQRGHHGRNIGAAGFQGGPAHNQRRDEVKTGALNREQTRPHRAPGFNLNDGGHAGGEQGHADDVLRVLSRKAQSLAN